MQILALVLAACAVASIALAVRWTRQAARDRQEAALLLASACRSRQATRRW